MKKPHIIIYIDSSKQDTASVGISINGAREDIISESKVFKAQMILPLVEKVLKEKNLDIKDVSDIQVNTGPGSYTGIRVGLSVANALGFLLHIPVNGKHALEKPQY